MREHTEPITFRASDALVAAIDKMAEDNNITRAQMVHRAVSDRCGFGVALGIKCTDPGIHRGKPIYPTEIIKPRMKTVESGPYGTSKQCSECGSIGQHQKWCSKK